MSNGYQVALSFAGEDRDYVERVARSLDAKGVRIFYNRFEETNLWGRDLAEHLHSVFSKDSAVTVMFISKPYVEKMWPRHERRSAMSRALASKEPTILPVRFDDAEVPGLPTTVAYLDLGKITPEQLALKICERIGIDPNSVKASAVPPPHSTSHTGEVAFDYSSHNGMFSIGEQSGARQAVTPSMSTMIRRQLEGWRLRKVFLDSLS